MKADVKNDPVRAINSLLSGRGVLRQRAIAFLTGLLLSSGVSAATFTQTDWTGGATANTAADPANQTGWNQYPSKEAGLGASADLTLPASANSRVHTNNADFAAATNRQRHTTFKDFSGAGALLTNAKVNNGAVGIKPATLVNSWAAKSAWNFTHGMPYDAPALADLDGDGDLDMLIGQSNGNTEGYENIGSDESPVWSLKLAWRVDRFFEGGYRSHAVPALGDFDGDGDADLFLGFDGNKIYALENIGGPSRVIWSRKSAWDLTNAAGSVSRGVLVNLDGSGYPELVTGGGWSVPNLYVFQFNGSSWSRVSSWEPLPHTTANGFPSNEDIGRAAAGDLDGDGDLDLVAGWRYRDALVGYTNTGTASVPAWTSNFTLAVPAGDYHNPALVDLDSDGDLDILKGSAAGGTLQAYENQSTTYFTSATYTSAVLDSGSHSGYTTLNYSLYTPASTGVTIDVRAGNTVTPDASWTAWQTNVASGADISALGTGRYVQYRANFSTADTSRTPLLKEIQINYLAYPLASNVLVADNKMRLSLNSRTVSWDTSTAGPWSLSLTSGAQGPDNNFNKNRPALGDLNNDGFPDLLLGDDYSVAIGAYVHNGSNGWTYQSGWNVPSGTGSTWSALADIDGDGDLDAFINTPSDNTVVTAYRNDGSASAPVWVAAPSWNINLGLAGANAYFADLDNDGDLDAMVGHVGGAYTINGYENQAATPTSAPVWVAKPSWDYTLPVTTQYSMTPRLVDIDGDGDYDMVVGDADTSIYTVENAGTLQSPYWGPTPSGWNPPVSSAVSFAEYYDFDNDGDPDAVIGGTGSGAIITRYNTSTSSYAASGSYTSAALDFGTASYTTLTYNLNLRTGTAITIDLRGGNSTNPEDGSWTAWQTNIASGGDISAFNGKRYLQYRVNLTANGDNTLSPELKDITINYTGISSPQVLISSPYDTGVAGNFMSSLSWNQVLTAGSDVRIQLRTSPDNSAWTAWVGPDGTAASYWNSANTYGGGCSGTTSISCATMAANLKDGANDRWFQYKVTLVATGATSPTFSDIAIGYVSTLPPGLTLSKTSGLATSEAGGSDSFSVVLDSLPAGDVTVTLSSNKPGEAQPSPATLTFTTANWSTPQNVTVNGVDDFVDDGDIAYVISVDPSSVADPNYDALATSTVSGTNSDNDTAGITVNPTTGLTTAEAGTTSDTFTIVLTSEPLANVMIDLSSSDTTEGTVAPATVTFTPGNWSVAQTVTVTGVDDYLDDGNIAYTIVTASARSNDLLYRGINPSDVGVTNVDNDTVSITVNPTSTLSTTEAGGKATFTVVLGSQPSSNVSVAISTSNGNEGIVSPSLLTFTAANWNVAQTVTVTGQDDGFNDGNISYTIFLEKASSADPAYDGYVLPYLNAINQDNDTPALIVTPTSGLTTSEAGTAALFTVRLGSMPSATVTVNITSNDTSEGLVVDPVLSFDSGDWNMAKNVNIAGVDDPTSDGDVAYTVSVKTAAGGDAVYSALAAVNVSLTNLDDEGAGASSNAFSQTNWKSGTPGNASTCAAVNGVWSASQCTARDPNNQAGWQAYYSKESGVEVINSGADLRGGIVNKSVQQSSNGDFGITSSSKYFTTYSDFAAGATLANAKVNNGAVGLKPATYSNAWTAKAAWDFATGMSVDAPAYADLDGDGDMDMLIGQSNGNTEGYRNSGSDESAVWESYPGWRIDRFLDGGYRAYAVPTLADFDGDGDVDLFIGYDGNKFYAFENTGTKTAAIWTRKSAWDLVQAAGNVSRGTLVNLDGSAYPEMVSGGGYGNATLYVYQFDGANWARNPAWEPLPHTTANGFPSNEDAGRAAAGDLNGDGDFDLVVGWRFRDDLVGYTNTGSAAVPAWNSDFSFAVVAGDYHTPALVDLDSDGDLDIMKGSSASQTLFAFENTGTVYNASGSYTSAVLDLGTHNGFTTLVYSTYLPTNTSLSVDIRAADSVDFVSNSSGWLTGISSGADLSASLGSRRYVQYRINLATSNTGVTPLLKDLIINYIVYPWGDKVVAAGDALSLKPLSRTVVWSSYDTWDHGVGSGSPDANNGNPSPALGDMDGDGDLDLLRGDNWSQNISFYRNDGNNVWTYMPAWNLYCCASGGETRPLLADMDNDGDLDVILAWNGAIVAFENIGTATAPAWGSGTPAPRKLAWEIAGSYSGIDLADLDNDGDLDALVGDNDGIWAYENVGSKSNPAWQAKGAWNLPETSCAGCNWWAVAPALADLDGDGDFDLLVGNKGGDWKPYAFENTGTASAPVWARKSAWDPLSAGTRSHFDLADLDDDGDVDMLYGGSASTIDGYRNTGVTTYAASGSYTSAALDFGTHLGFTTVDYVATIRTGTSLTVQVRSGNTATPDGSWSGWQSIASGADISAYGTNRYLQYRVNMTANGGNTASPSLYSIKINYSGVALQSALISSAYNSASAVTLINGLSWTENLAAGTDVRVQLRSAPDNAGAPGAWSDWLGPDGTANSYWNSANSFAGGCSGTGVITCGTIPPLLRNGQNNQWLQYKVILVSSGNLQPTFSDISVFYTTGSDGSALVTVTPATLNTTENPGGTPTATFNITLSGSPSSNVVVQLGSGDLSEGTVSPASLTFSAGDLGPKTVTVTAVDDTQRDGNVTYKVFTSATISSDASFNNLIVSDVSVTNADDDLSAGGVLVTPTSGLVTTEGGGTATFSIVLRSAPVSDVQIVVDSSDLSEGLVSPNLLTFTSANWSTPQVVTITGQNDTLFDQNQAYTIVTSATISSDPNYNGVAVDDVSVTNTDDETTDVLLVPDDVINGLTVNENGGARTFSVKLASQPAANVKFKLVSSDLTEGTVFPFSYLTFTPSNWNVAQLGTVYGVDDDIVDGDIAFKIMTTPYISTDPNFNGIDPPDFDATNLDNDGVFAIKVTPSSGLITTESGGQAIFKIELASKPSADVIINLTSSKPNEGYVPQRVVLRPTDISWRGTLVTVSGVDDNIVDGDQAYTIVTSAAVSTDPNYNGINPADVSLINRSTNAGYMTMAQNGANAGRAVAYADVNGDGYADAVAGAPNYDGAFANNGRVMVYYGSAAGVVSGPAWSAEGDQLDAFFGHAVAKAGDVNNDGYDDIIIGAYGRNIGGIDEGRVYIYHGSASGLPGTPSQTLSGAAGSGFFGFSVAGAGDVDGDGYSDVIVGAYGEDKVYIYHGSASGIGATPAQTLVGDQAGSRFGISVSGGVDVNGDGYSDVIIGADLYDNGQTDEGRAFVYHGSASGISASAAWSKESDQANAYFGRAVAAAGDVNKDGYGDVLIGAYAFDNGQTDEGRVFAYHGSASGLSASANITMESNQAGAYYGYAVAHAGDVNNDGYADVIVGAPAYDNGQTDEGRAIVYYGSSTGINPAPGLTFEIDQASANLGVAVAGNGYFNGDSYGDLLVGADLYDGSQTDEGAAIIYRAPPQKFGVSVTPTAGLQTSEAGAIASFSLVLNAPPSADVILESFVGDSSEGVMVSAALLTFTPANWNIAQTIYVRGVDDSIDDGDVYYDVITISRSSDVTYNNLAIDSVRLLNLNDEYSVNVVASDASIGETGPNSGSFTFSRTGSTAGELLVYYSIGGTAQNSVDYTGLFGIVAIPAGQSSKEVVVMPVDDAIADPGETITVTLINKNTYLLGSSASATMTIVDNDAPGITVSPISGLVTNEAGGIASFTVVLNTQPTDSVSIALSSDTPAEGLPQPASLTFTSGNWSTPQTVTVVGQDDAGIDGDIAYKIITAAAVSSDASYNGINPDDVALINADNDLLPNVSIAATVASVSEGGGVSGIVSITRSGSTAADLSVRYQVGGTAVSGTHYTAIGTTTVIPAGSSRVDVAIVPLDNALIDGDKSVTVTLAGGSGYIVGRTGSATVTILDDDLAQAPVANFGLDQSVGDGKTVAVSVYLSQEALAYPVLIPYTVSGTAVNPADHNAANGTIVIASGKSASMSFNVVDDGLGDANETVIFTMGSPTNAQAGARNVHTVTIIEENKAPKVTLGVTQGAGNINLVVAGNGNVTVSATVADPNPGDSHTYDWSLSNNNLVEIDDGNPATFVFNPAALLDGYYKVRLSVSDNGTPVKTTSVDLLLQVLFVAPALSTADSDGDGISDDMESFYDSDKDGIPDYLDSSTLASNELQYRIDRQDYILRTDAGLTLRLGDTAIAAGGNGAKVSQSDIASYGGGEANPGVASAQDTVANSGGYFDFKIVGLPQAGQSARIVIPQENPIPLGAVYRKYHPTTGWQDFVVDANNQLASAAGQAGLCPLPGDAAYTPGLSEGHNCIQLTLQDGGANDMDGIANHVIDDPSVLGHVQGVEIAITSANGGSGGGALGWPWLLWLLLAYGWRVRRLV